MGEEDLVEIVDDAEIVDDDEEQIDPEAYGRAKAELEERCRSAHIEVSERQFPDGENYLVVGLPNGREKRSINLSSIEQINTFLSIPFERYTFLGDYVAICSYGEGTVEAVVRVAGGHMPSSSPLRRLLSIYRLSKEEDEQDKSIEVRSEEHDPPIIIRLAPIPAALRILSRGTFFSRTVGIFITGLHLSQHNHALNLLEKMSNSLFLQIDMLDGVQLSLVKERRRSRPARRSRRENEFNALEFPKTEYDEAPISLYWYARSAVGMPLLQFLAYYQVVEFFFYTYSQEVARRKIRAILKDPVFRLDRDGDIGRILSAVTTKGRGYGDERSQLRATLQACIDPADLRKFLTESDERAQFFSNKQKGLTNHKLPIGNIETDLRGDVAELLYDIRCKIVHTKGEGHEHEGDVELLLPFSKEADLLFHDIELLQYIARRVLISASSPLRY